MKTVTNHKYQRFNRAGHECLACVVCIIQCMPQLQMPQEITTLGLMAETNNTNQSSKKANLINLNSATVLDYTNVIVKLFSIQYTHQQQLAIINIKTVVEIYTNSRCNFCLSSWHQLSSAIKDSITIANDLFRVSQKRTNHYINSFDFKFKFKNFSN